MEKCRKCGVELIKDDKALCKKLLGKKTQQFLCRAHLAEFLNVNVDDLTERIEQFKEDGCTLFL